VGERHALDRRLGAGDEDGRAMAEIFRLKSSFVWYISQQSSLIYYI